MKDLYGNELHEGDKVVFKFSPFRETVYLRIGTIERFGINAGEDIAYLKDIQWMPEDLTLGKEPKTKYRWCKDILGVQSFVSSPETNNN